MGEEAGWRRCSSCKSPIAFDVDYWVCNVSTCNRKRTGLIFCTVSCWEVHLSSVNHRESWAVERRSPSRAEWQRAQAEEAASGETGAEAAARPRRRIVPAQTTASPSRTEQPPREVLIVASRLKNYVLHRVGYRTSDGVLDALSDVVRAAVDEAIENARRAERRTVLERDVPAPRR